MRESILIDNGKSRSSPTPSLDTDLFRRAKRQYQDPLRSSLSSKFNHPKVDILVIDYTSMSRLTRSPEVKRAVFVDDELTASALKRNLSAPMKCRNEEDIVIPPQFVLILAF